jgi:hypothetical protein
MAEQNVTPEEEKTKAVAAENTPPSTTINIAELFNESPEINGKALEKILEDKALMDQVLQTTGKNENGRNLVELALGNLIFAIDSQYPIAYEHPTWQVVLTPELLKAFKAKIQQAKTVIEKA